MTGDTFDPFDLPSSFDPLGSEAPPPPRRRRVGGAASPSGSDRPEQGLEPAAVGAVRGDAGVPTTPIGAGDRLAHLLRPAPPPGDDGTVRLAALEAQVADLTARVAALEAQIRAPTQAPVTGAAAVSGKHRTGKRPARKTRLPPFLR